MPLNCLRAQVVFPHASTLPRDVMTNTFHLRRNQVGPWESQADVMTTHLRAFYDAISATAPLRADFRPALAHVNWYNLDDPPERVAHTVPLQLANTNTTDTTTPAEVAIVLSFQGDPVAGVAQARRRGRVFIGGRGNLVTASTSTTPPLVHPLTVTAIADAAAGLRSSLANETTETDWVVYSPTAGTITDVVRGWVDNELDTQRRRGFRSGTRTLWGA